MGKTFKSVSQWAAKQGVHVEKRRRGESQYEVYTDGSIVAECRTLDEVIDSVPEFVKTPN